MINKVLWIASALLVMLFVSEPKLYTEPFGYFVEEAK
jgi:hypothetical protein